MSTVALTTSIGGNIFYYLSYNLFKGIFDYFCYFFFIFNFSINLYKFDIPASIYLFTFSTLSLNVFIYLLLPIYIYYIETDDILLSNGSILELNIIDFISLLYEKLPIENGVCIYICFFLLLTYISRCLLVFYTFLKLYILYDCSSSRIKSDSFAIW